MRTIPIDETQLRYLYSELGLSAREVGRKLGASQGVILRYLGQLGITRPKGQRKTPRMTIAVGTRFGKWTVTKSPYPSGTYANGHTRYLADVTCDCGTKKSVIAGTLRNGSSASCGCWKPDHFRSVGARRGSEHGAWKGGRQRRHSGYVLIRDPDHPNAWSNGYVPEHIKVMSEHLGRPMMPDETVHHKNGQRDDNRLGNLEVWSHSQPYGQRVEDKTAWAEEWLLTHEPSPGFIQALTGMGLGGGAR